MLSRLNAFLPQISASNAQLMDKLENNEVSSKEIDIEEVDPEHYIEMVHLLLLTEEPRFGAV